MDQHAVRPVRRECLETETHRILALGPARRRRQQVEAGQRRIIDVAVFRPDRQHYAVDPWMCGESRHRMAQHTRPAERQILFWQRPAEAGPPAGSENESVNRPHRLNTP
jgi:hypothetical protein